MPKRRSGFQSQPESSAKRRQDGLPSAAASATKRTSTKATCGRPVVRKNSIRRYVASFSKPYADAARREPAVI
jgi:hypothetical protein